jgi:hypothetical protein
VFSKKCDNVPNRIVLGGSVKVLSAILFIISTILGILVLLSAATISQLLIFEVIRFEDAVVIVVTTLYLVGIIVIGWVASRLFTKAREIWNS